MLSKISDKVKRKRCRQRSAKNRGVKKYKGKGLSKFNKEGN